MGTWGVDPFDNDGAMDLVAEWEDMSADDRLVRTRAMLDAAGWPHDQWTADLFDDEVIASVAMVAANVSSGQHLYWNYVPDGLAGWLPQPVSPDLVQSALAALRVATGPGSWWLDSWNEAGSAEDALNAVEPVRIALAHASQQPGCTPTRSRP